jgi:undecaprenyl-diphosphatase
MTIIVIAIILGIVEGITEFLPISSTGHLILVNQFLNLSENENFVNMFDIVIQLGAIWSVVIYFRDRLIPHGKDAGHNKGVWDLWKKAIIGVIPALIIGGILGSKIKKLLFNPTVVAIALIVGGIILIVIENHRKTARITSVSELSYQTAGLIGLIQCIAMIPGTSRSAATIIGAMLLGCSRIVAAEFSFFLAIPTMTAATAYELMKTGQSLASQEWMVLSIGFAVSFLSAWAVIAFFMNYIRNKDFKLFAYYRIILGIIVFVYFALTGSGIRV